MLERVQRKGNPLTLLVGMHTSTDTMENSVNIPLKKMDQKHTQICSKLNAISSVQLLSHVRLCDPMNHSMSGLPGYHQNPESTQTHVHRLGDTIQPSHPLSSPSPPAPNSSQHQGLFQ